MFSNLLFAQSCNPVDHNPYTDFNSSSNQGTATTLWLNIHTKLLGGSSGLPHNGDFIMFAGGVISLNNVSSNPTVTNSPIPRGKIIADNTVSAPATIYDAAKNMWITRVPVGYTTSNIFISAAIINSSNGFSVSGGGKSSAISGQWVSNRGAQFTSQWFYGLACYQPQFNYLDVDSTNEVRPINSGGQQAGTPTTENAQLVAGGSGGGGSNYTGSYSSTEHFTGCQQVCSGLSVSISVMVISCHNANNGSATVNGTGGITPYTYVWNTGAITQTISNLSAGPYTVTLTDYNECSIATSTALINPDVLNLTPSHVDASCFAGSNGGASVTATGGTPSYSYLWNTGTTTSSIANLTAGSYTVTVSDSHGCSASASITVSQPLSAVSVSMSKTDVTITGGSNGIATANPSGGTPGYTFVWSTGATTQTITGRTAGTYTVTVTDSHGCTASNNITINQPPCSLAMSQTHIEVSCYNGSNGSITISVSGSQGSVSYIWNAGATTQNRSGLSAGTYTVTATDNGGCTASGTITISQPSSSVSVSMSKTDVTITGWSDGTATANPSGGTPGYTFVWSTGATTQTITGRTAGTYTVTVTDSHGCTASNNVTINQPPCSLSMSQTHIDVSCYNGSNGSITISVSGAQGSVSYTWNAGATTQNRSGLSAGTYTVTATDDGGCTASGTITISQPSSSVSVSMSKTDVTITNGSDGTATANPSGGTSGYTFLWSTSATTQTITGLSAGTYTVTVTDSHGCTAGSNITVNQPGCTINMSETHIDVSCHDGSNGSITITVSGAQGTVTYLWNDGATTQNRNGLTAGTYAVTATDQGGCAASRTITISQPSSSVSVSMSKSDVTITGGSNGTATANPSGGTPGYTFLWSTSATTQTINGLIIGTYTVTVTDSHGCTASNYITINQPPCTLSMSETHIDVLCHDGSNGSITITVSGAQGTVTYLWNDGATTQNRSGFSAGTYTVTATDQGGCAASNTTTISQPSSSVSISMSKTDVTVHGGSDGTATANPSGGTPAYTFLWSTGATIQTINGLTIGTFTVTATDSHGCTASNSITINQPNCSLSLSQTHSDVSCYSGNNGSITITASGAQGTVSYVWNDGATTQNRTGLSAGTYTITGTDQSGCSASINNILIQQPSSPVTVSISKTEITHMDGHNGTATATASGGTQGYTYLWSTGATTTTITGLAAKTYTVTATDSHGCTGSNNITINQPNCLFFLSENYTNVSCYGGNNGVIIVGIHQCTGIVTYIWNDGATTKIRNGLSAGTYSVTATDENGCVAYNTIVIQQPSSAVSVSMSKTDVTSNGGSNGTATATASGGTPGYTYLWSNGGTTSTISNLTAATYTVTVTDSHGCAASNGIVINQPSYKEAESGLAGKESISMKLYPNPAQDKFSIEVTTQEDSEKEYTGYIENILGQIIYSTQGQSLNGLVMKDISFNPPIPCGMYIIHIIIGNEEVTKQLIIQ